MRTVLSIAAGTALALLAPAALAQEASGSVGGSVNATGTLPPPPAVTTTTTTQSTTTVKAADADDGVSDHEKYAVGHFAVGYLGLSSIPISGAGLGNGAPARDTISAPIIGGRYWLNERFGIDAGIGLGWTSGGSSTETANTSQDTDDASRFGIALHGGVPIALAYHKHYKFLVVPELNLGFAHSSETSPVANADDISHNGFLLDIGARAGAEIHFGFIGIPELALQATVGLYFRHEQWSSSQGDNSISRHTNTLGTTVQSDPWALFTNNISALYYFP